MAKKEKWFGAPYIVVALWFNEDNEIQSDWEFAEDRDVQFVVDEFLEKHKSFDEDPLIRVLRIAEGVNFTTAPVTRERMATFDGKPVEAY